MKKKLDGLFLLLLIVLSGWSFFAPSMFLTHDYVHGARIAEMARGLIDGQIPVRWSANFGFGYGMPLFIFYAPLPYFVGALFWLAGLPMAVVIKLLFWLSSALIAVGTYKLVARRFASLAGLVAAAVAISAPYRAVNIFVRGSLSELWGLMFFPWLLWAIDDLFLVKSKRYWPLGLIAGLLLLSHNLTALLVLPTTMIWFALNLWQLWQTKTLQQYLIPILKKTFLASALAAGLSAFYVLPAFTEKGLTQLDNLITGGYFDYHLHFIYLRQLFLPRWGYGGSGWGVEDGFSFFLGFAQWLVLLLVFLAIFKRFKKSRTLKDKDLLIGLSTLLALGVNIWLATFKSLAVWENLAGLEYLQFPWRFLGPTAVCLAILAGYLIYTQNFLKKSMLALLIFFFTLINLTYFRPANWQDHTNSHYYSDAKLIRSQMSQILPDYLPTSLRQAELEPAHQLVIRPESSDDIQVLLKTSNANLLRTVFRNPEELTFAVAAYPGWRLEIDGQAQPYQITDQGLISTRVSAGEKLISLTWRETPVRTFANLVSLAALIYLLGILPIWKLNND